MYRNGIMSRHASSRFSPTHYCSNTKSNFLKTQKHFHGSWKTTQCFLNILSRSKPPSEMNSAHVQTPVWYIITVFCKRHVFNDIHRLLKHSKQLTGMMSPLNYDRSLLSFSCLTIQPPLHYCRRLLLFVNICYQYVKYYTTQNSIPQCNVFKYS